MLEELKANDVIEESKSSWSNPVVLARKTNGKLRFCVDFRKLNQIVELDQFQIPRINELISYLSGAKYFTLIDLKDGFFQIPIRQEDRMKTAFYSGDKLYQFKKMPQGYKNSPAIFQKAMSIMFSEVIGNGCLIYIDDILIYGKNEDEHNKNLRIVENILENYKLKENKEKRIERVQKIRFLGYEISYNQIKPTLDRSQGIMEYERPKNKRSLQRFLGMCNYDRMFIKNITEKIAPLYKLLTKDSKFIWDEKHDETFRNVKELWKKELNLYLPDFNKEFYLETDASKIGLGAVLRQENGPIAYISRSLSNAEKKYSITEREVLAAIWAMEKFAYYLRGRRFKLTTDHKAMCELKNKLEFGSYRVQRWFDRIERFDLKSNTRKEAN